MNDVQFYFEEFYPFAKQALGFDKDATVVFESDLANAKNPLGKTAHYDPSNSTVTVYVDKRHPKDVLRSISHELVHHAQNLRGDLNAGSMEEGYAQEDDHLRKMEEEAYRKGNMVFRDWTDTRNNPEGQKNIMSRLMQEWGYDEQALELDENLNFEEGQLVVVVASALAVDGEKTGTVVNSDDKSVTIKLDDDQEGKYVPEDKMVKVRKDYVEPRAESGFDDVMGESEEVNEMYDDDFDMDSLEDEFPWLKKDMGAKKGAPPADVAADLDAEFGDMMAAHQDEEEEETLSEEDYDTQKDSDLVKYGRRRGRRTKDSFGNRIPFKPKKSSAEKEEEEDVTVMKEGGSMAEYGKIDAEDGNPPSKVGRGNEEYMEAYNAVLVARGEQPLDIQKPDQAYLDALHGGRLEEDFRFSDEEKAMLDKMSKKEFSDYVTRGRYTTPDLKGDMGELPGMEGPFQYKSGAVLYYDTRTGEYYDRGRDMYLDRDEAAKLTMEEDAPLRENWSAVIDKAQSVLGYEPELEQTGDGYVLNLDGPLDEVDEDGLMMVFPNGRKLDDTTFSTGISPHMNEGMGGNSDTQEVADAVIDSIGGEPDLDSDDVYRAIDEILTIMDVDVDEDEVAQLVMDELNIMENKIMKLEEMVRQAVRKALTEKKNYRREDEKEEESVEEMKYRREDEDSEEKSDLEEGNQESRTITQIEKIGDEVSNLAGMVTDPAVAERLEMVDQMVTDLLGQMQGVEPMGMEEAESTEKYDDDPALKGDQDELPDHLQKAIIDKDDDKEENVDEETNKEWYDSSLFENLVRKWAK